jgi:prepilin-type N-terminal cleavage/methylation domain-containing protein
MTSTARKCDPRAGFTLLEIVMVLVIASLVMAGAVGLMVYSSDENSLRKTSGEVELMAKTARVTAILKQTPYAIEFRYGVVRMLPFALAGREERKTNIHGRRRQREETELPPGVEQRQITLPDGMDVTVRRWNSDKWLATGKDSIHVWRFDPDGLCEPLSIRLSLSKSYVEDSFNPLTGAIRDTQMEVR